MPLTPDQVRAKIARELRYLQRFLRTTARVTSTNVLTDAAIRCEREKPDGNPQLWGYTFAGIVFQPEDLTHILPPDATNIRVELSMSVIGHCEPTPDPLASLSINVVVKGERIENGSKNDLVFSWHLDRHMGDQEEGDYSHPRYHFQHAGSTMRGTGNNWGNAIFVEPPRLMHPPMDAFLASDFILSNFLPRARRKLARDGNYRKYLRESQKEIWKPYVDALACAWGEKRGESLCRDFWPDLV